MPIEFDIRKADKNDIYDVARLSKEHLEYIADEGWNSNYDFSWPLSDEAHEHYSKFLSDDGKILFLATSVGDNEGDIIGFLLGAIKEAHHRTDTPYAEIENIYIAAGYRCSGIGAGLMEEFIGWAKASGAKRVRAQTYFDNRHARKYYEKGGLKEKQVIYEVET